MAQMSALRRRMIDDMTVRNRSPATQQSYVYTVAKFSRFFVCSPDRLGIEEVAGHHRSGISSVTGPCWSTPLSHDPVAGVLLLSGVGAWPPPDGVV